MADWEDAPISSKDGWEDAPLEKKRSKERTWTEAAKDIAASGVSGVGSLVQLPGQLYGLATGDFSETGALGLGKDIEKYGEEMKSAGLRAREQERQQKVAEAAKSGQLSAFGAALGETLKDPALLTSFLAEQAPQLLVPFGVGRAGAAGAKALGVGAKAAEGLTGAEAVAAAQKAIGAAGAKAAIGAGSVQQGADIGAGAYESIYKELRSQGLSEKDAADSAINLARAAGASGALISLLAQRLPGAKRLEEALAGVEGKGGRLATAGRAIAGELPSENVEEVGGKLAQNIAMQQVKPDQSLTEGLGETAAMATLGAVGMSGAVGLAQRQAREMPKVEPAKEEEKPLMLGMEKPFSPVVFPDGSVATTPEDVVRYEEEQFRKKYEPQPTAKEEPLGESLAALRASALMGGETKAGGELAALIRARREEQEAKAEIPASGTWEFLFLQRERLNSEPKSKERDALIGRIDEELLKLGTASIEQLRKDQEMAKSSAFGQEELPPVMPRELALAPEVEPFAKPTQTTPGQLLGKQPEGGGLASILAARREEGAPAAEVPLTGGYGFLQREKQRLQAMEQTPETKATLQRIDAELKSIVEKEVEQARLDKEMSKKSVFAQEELPPVESRSDVMGKEALSELQAKEGTPPSDTVQRGELGAIRALERARAEPAPASELEMKIAEAEKEKAKIKSTNLRGVLQGKLSVDEVADIAPGGKGFENLSAGQKGGTYISELIADGTLNDYLPPAMRPDSSRFDAQESSEYIKEKLRNKENLSFDAEMATRQIDNSIAEMQTELAKQREAEVRIAEATGRDELPDFKRKEGVGTTIGLNAVKAISENISSKWANGPGIEVVQNMNDPAIPEPVRRHNEEQKAKGAKGEPQAFFYKGKAYLVADQISSGREAVEALLHESVGHYGLRGTFGKNLTAVLQDIVKHRRSDVSAMADKYGLDMTREDDRLAAAEEVLAHMAQTKPGLTFVRRAIAAIRNWLRDRGFNVSMSDSDIIQKVILPSQRFVEKGAKTEVEGKPAYLLKEAGEKAKQVLQKREQIDVDALADVDKGLVDQLGKIFNPQSKTVVDRVEGLRDNFWKKMAQGIADQYRTIKDYDPKAYMMARMSKTIDGGLEGLMFHGHVFNNGGALDIKQNTKGLMEAMKPVGKEADRYLMWVALNRDARLPAEKRSIDPEIVKRRGELAQGAIDGKSRLEVYQQVQRDMNALNKSVLDVAYQAGLIDKAGYDRFSQDIFYVPFYRAMEDGDVQGAQTASGLTGQRFSKELMGGQRAFGDLMENTLRNWSHILSASMKNQAARASLNAAQKMGAAHQIESQQKGAVKVMIDGQPAYYDVDDPMLLEAITSIGYMGPKSKFLDVARDFKNMLQFGVTVSPAFKIRNLFRDSVSALAITDLKRNPFANVIEGWVATDKNNPAHISALAGGAIFNFGSVYEGDQAKLVKRLLKQGVKEEHILDTPDKIKAGLLNLWGKYQDWGNKSEAANRMALYNQLRNKGLSHLEASFQARDMLDFSMQGAWPAFRWLTQVIPFLNARIQGLYKLGRDGVNPTVRVIYNAATGKEITGSDRKRAEAFSTVMAMTALASLMLYAAFKDDEDFQKRDDWDRDNFWWIKLPNMDYAVRIPKPFEVGAFGTLAERTAEQIFDQGAEGKQFADSLTRMLTDTFAVNLPQFIKPLVDLYANKDSFTGAPIESAGMERLSKAERATDSTSEIAKALGGVMNAALPEKVAMSPVQVDYAIKAYFGWLGGTAAWASNYAVMPFEDGTRPDNKWTDTMSAGFIKTLPTNQSRYVTAFYENNKQISQAFADMRHYAEIGDSEKVQKIMEEKGDMVQLAKFYDKTSKDMSRLRKAIRVIDADKDMPGDQKREEIDRLKQLISDLAEQAENARKQMKQ